MENERGGGEWIGPISSFPKVVLEMSQESGTVLGAWEQTGFSEKVKRAGMALR